MAATLVSCIVGCMYCSFRMHALQLWVTCNPGVVSTLSRGCLGPLHISVFLHLEILPRLRVGSGTDSLLEMLVPLAIADDVLIDVISRTTLCLTLCRIRLSFSCSNSFHFLHFLVFPNSLLFCRHCFRGGRRIWPIMTPKSIDSCRCPYCIALRCSQHDNYAGCFGERLCHPSAEQCDPHPSSLRAASAADRVCSQP